VRWYGAHPLHLLALLGCFALAGYAALLTARANSSWPLMLVWFVGAIIAHDLVLFPLYALADRSLRSGAAALAARLDTRADLPSPLNYMRVPLLGCALTFLVFFPGIVREGASSYRDATGQTQEPFLGRWLLLCAGMLGLSAVSYALRAGRAIGASRHFGRLSRDSVAGTTVQSRVRRGRHRRVGRSRGR
jgi:hypothetical protein